MEWFEEWFDSPLYEKLYSGRDDDEAEMMVNLITGLVKPATSPVLLDLACGRGRHSLQLAEQGFRVTGLDLSERAIRIAQEKAARVARNRPLFRTGDMRKPLDSRYNAIVNLFTSFGYFEHDDDNLQVLKNVHLMLLTDGWFVQDYLNPQWVRSNLRASENGHIDHTGFSIRRKIEDGFVKKMMTFTDHRTGSTASFTERVKLFDREWFSKAYAAAGLKTCAVYGSYSGDAFDELKSPRIILFSRKPG
ncbi:MAG: class I SAM-dependent methyltransferase [Balneolaceae bacterium]|jgi:SAM-dependent methyltransferase|nr:MAG: class I SAM-dependent methyltransferase [Balneolaceae bacterium]